MEEKKTRPVSRRKRGTGPIRHVAPDGTVIKECYCRKCRMMKKPTEFLEATDTFLDTSGKMSVCKSCIDQIYEKIYMSEGDIGKTILRMCRMLNVSYVPKGVQATISQVNRNADKGKETDNVFSLYKSKISSLSKINDNDDLTFDEPGVQNIVMEEIELDDEEVLEELKQFWGDGLSFDDYQFLESELSEWKKSFSCNNRSEEFYLKEICLKQLDIRKARIEGKDVDAKIKAIDAILKSAALTPAQTSAASSGKVADTIGTWIKRVENDHPCEYYKDKNLFNDFDNLGLYISNYIKRPILNFLSGQKNFEILDDNEISIDTNDPDVEVE